jgi:hypothetical protein
MTHDFKAALSWVDCVDHAPYCGFAHGEGCIYKCEKEKDTIKRALLIADALMGEPTEAMETVGQKAIPAGHGQAWLYAKDCFKAIRDKILEGIKV